MKTIAVISLLFFSFGALADEVQSGSGSISVDGQAANMQNSNSNSENQARLDQLVQNISTIDSARKIRYLKNPCAGIKGYRFQYARGFGFEDGIVKVFTLTGNTRYEKSTYRSLGDFMRSQHLCAPANKKLPALNINLYASEIF